MFDFFFEWGNGNSILSSSYCVKSVLAKSILNQYPSVIDSIAKEKLLRFVQENARKYFVIKNELDTMSSKETRYYIFELK
ncbi:hypothetical protein DERP_014387 [Dermatophagoides pteronyssinus]|uniref:Uncharacterized protein n=1 Tax=Dermatophagoides pteronyssinus TaxID=6956 RepID=A0ABQ8J6E2_DERPT|nr:hypothetical protein DERP_014387 [Dermatophagoides pteronyssinus]